MTNLVLVGDSIFDNGAYVRPGEAVIDELRSLLNDGQEATLLARDGAVLSGVRTQLDRLPDSATHLFVSAGGNDALGHASVLSVPASSVADALARIEPVRDGFADAYRTMLDAVARHDLPTTICTIYDSRFPDPVERRLSNLALGMLNDVITREAVSRRLPFVDLRVLFSDPEDYANAIEPSGQGSRKIAKVVVDIVSRHDFDGPSTAYGG